MNIRATTQAAEGLPRRAFTVAEIEAMVEAGIILEDERFELIGGEVVPMSPKGNRHELIKVALNLDWARRLPNHLRFASETTFRLSPDTFLEPDFTFYTKADNIPGLKGSTALLVVELSDTSLGYDLGRKPAIYASFGVRELWVIDVLRMATHVNRAPGPDGYATVTEHESNALLTPLAAPELAVRLADLEL
jgi:Uma2 family endonuclease